MIDTNGDGYISDEEFKIYFQVIGSEISEAEVNLSFKSIDSNGDGEISREEFVSAGDEFIRGMDFLEILFLKQCKERNVLSSHACNV